MCLSCSQLAVQSKINSEGAGGADRLFATLANGNGFTTPFAELDYSAVHLRAAINLNGRANLIVSPRSPRRT